MGKSRASSDRSIVDTDGDESDASEGPAESETRSSEEFPSLRAVQDKLRAIWNQSIEEKAIKYKPLRSGDSSMIPAKSLAKSAFSAKFARYGARKSRSASVLDALPKVSCFRRRNRDRCLSCMHESLRETDETDTGGVCSRATLLTEIEAEDDSESSSSSDGLPEFQEELRTIMDARRERIPIYPGEVEDVSGEATPSSRQVEQEDVVAVSPKVDPSQPKGKTPTEGASLSRASKSMKTIPTLISITSERSKISSSETHTSDEEPSSPLALADDPSQYKNMAPCHLPTILLHSMEPLRALRHRKPTTMEARIALMESVTSTKEKSDDEYHEDAKVESAEAAPREKPRMAEAEKTPAGRKDDARGSRTLLKVKSEQLIPPIAVRENGLRRGHSCASIEDLSRDSTRGTFEIPRSRAEDGVISPADGAKESAPSGSLPLSTVAEILRFLMTPIRRNESPAIALQTLAREFSSRLMKRDDADASSTTTAEAARRAKIAARLTELLADSKRYLSPDKFPSDLVFSAKQPPVCNSRLLRRALPLDSYNLVAPLLGMPFWCPRPAPKKKDEHMVPDEEQEKEEEEEEGEIPFDLVVRTFRQSSVSFLSAFSNVSITRRSKFRFYRALINALHMHRMHVMHG